LELQAAMSQFANIHADEIHIGVGTVIHPSAIICGSDGGNARRIAIGDHCYVGEGVQIRCPDFSLGDYSKIHQNTTVHGYLPCHVGHNAWIGQNCIIDSIGGTTIGDNCGIGAHSQLWSHIKYGDTLEGCRFLSESPMRIGKDVWFVGHCIVSPIIAEDKSMAMAGSVITKNMASNTIYAGCPAVEISSKIGNQYAEVALDTKVGKLKAYLAESGVDASRIRIIAERSELIDSDVSNFIVSSRTYTKRATAAEIAFMKYLLPARAKFTPEPST
jgi:acetyltransferase-like isoleucine patch superfamily enzyme